MASLSSTGVGSGLDVNSLVTQLVAAERAPYDTRLAKVDTRLTTQFTALATLKGSLSAFQNALSPLKESSTFATRVATSSDEDIFKATAGAGAQPGSYDIQVDNLATAAKLSSAPIVGGASTAVGTGTLSISLGAQTFSVTTGIGTNTLASLRDAINKATDNPGVRATLVNAVDGTRLVLTSDKTGAANLIKVKSNGGDGGLNQFIYDPPTTTNMTGNTPVDAVVFVAGFEHHSASNIVDGAIEGISINLKKADPGEAYTLDVTYDRTAMQEKVQKFVDGYNELATQIAKLRSYDPETKAAGPLLGDATLRTIEAQLRRTITDPVASAAGAYTTLASLGITTTSTGTLQVDATKLNKAIDADVNAVASVFSAKDGVANKLATQITAQLATSGDIATRNTTIARQREDLNSQKEALELRIASVQARYLKQFTALDGLLSQLNTTSSYLTQQLSNSAKISGGS